MRTPRYFSRTLAAGARATIQATGRYVTVVSVSASTIQVGINDETPEQITPGMEIAVSDHVHRVHLVNSGGAAAVVVLYISDERIDFLQHTTLAAIQQLLTPGSTKTAFALAPVAKTGVGTTAIFAVNTSRKEVFVQADITNAGKVWLGTTNAVTVATAYAELLPGASLMVKDTVAVWACSENGTEQVRGYETT